MCTNIFQHEILLNNFASKLYIFCFAGPKMTQAPARAPRAAGSACSPAVAGLPPPRTPAPARSARRPPCPEWARGCFHLLLSGEILAWGLKTVVNCPRDKTAICNSISNTARKIVKTLSAKTLKIIFAYYVFYFNIYIVLFIIAWFIGSTKVSKSNAFLLTLAN